MIYLDNAATTFPKSETVYTAIDKANREYAFNAGRGSYGGAQKAALIIDETKENLGRLFHSEHYADVVLTPSITHALNQVLNGIRIQDGSTIYLSPYEHNAVARTIHIVAERNNSKVEILPLCDNLSIDIEKTEYLFAKESPAIVVVSAISNVTGYELPVRDIFTLAHQFGAVTVLDTAQAAGLIDIDMRTVEADIICFASHKTMMGPFGVGGFLIRKGLILDKVMAGGTGSDSLNLEMPDASPARYEASSMNIPAIYGLLAAIKEMDIIEHERVVRGLTVYLEAELAGIDNVKPIGLVNDKNIGIVSFVVNGYLSDDIGMILDAEFGIAVRAGYQCAPYIHDYLNDKQNHGCVRVGLGKYNTKEDIDALICALKTF